jgi:hypothetical protein
MKLTSKLQYSNCETGEFAEEKQRTYEETIQLIEAFPWAAQRDHLQVSLTNPSVTLQSPNNDFLKLAVFFNNTFVLHYFSPEDVLFTKSFTRLSEAYPYISNYFSESIFSPAAFRKENTWMQHNRKHFESQDFRYEITPDNIKTFLWKTSGFQFCITFVFLVVMLAVNSTQPQPLLFIILSLYFFCVGGGLNLILFFNYYRYAKNKILIMSKGNDIFFYGDAFAPTQYNKKDILDYTVVGPNNARSPIYPFAIFIIKFRDGSLIKIPDLFVLRKEMENKLTGCTKIEKNGFPYLKS